MKQLFTTINFLILFIGISFGQTQLTLQEFESFCDSNNLVFEMPEGNTIIDVKENFDLSYSFAVINKDSSMEIRYTIFPLKLMLKDYEESLKDTNSIMLNPNNLYKSIVQVNVLNMTGGQMYNISHFGTQAVNDEFNAEAGGTCFFEFNSGFGTGYKYGQFIYLHKDDAADLIITFMSNNKEKHPELMWLGFHSLKFK